MFTWGESRTTGKRRTWKLVRVVWRGAVGKVSRLAGVTRWPPTLLPSLCLPGACEAAQALLARLGEHSECRQAPAHLVALRALRGRQRRVGPSPAPPGIAWLRRAEALLGASSSIIRTSRDSRAQPRVKCPLLHFPSSKLPHPPPPTESEISPRPHTPQKTSRRNTVTAPSKAPAAGRRGVEHTMQ